MAWKSSNWSSIVIHSAVWVKYGRHYNICHNVGLTDTRWHGKSIWECQRLAKHSLFCVWFPQSDQTLLKEYAPTTNMSISIFNNSMLKCANITLRIICKNLGQNGLAQENCAITLNLDRVSREDHSQCDVVNNAYNSKTWQIHVHVHQFSKHCPIEDCNLQ